MTHNNTSYTRIISATPFQNVNKYASPSYCRAEMYAGRVACAPWWVTVSMRRILTVKKRRDRRRTDGRTPDHYITLIPLDAPSVQTKRICIKLSLYRHRTRSDATSADVAW